MDSHEMWRLHCRKGMSLDEVAERAGVSRYVVYRRVLAYRYERGEVVLSGRRLREMYWGQGMSIRQIADAEMCSVGLVCERLREEGIPRRPSGNPCMNSSRVRRDA